MRAISRRIASASAFPSTTRTVTASAALFGGLATLFGLGPPIVAAACIGALAGLWALRLIRTARLDERAEGPPAG